MSSPAVTKNEELVTKNQILTQAVKLFAEKGFNGVSMRDLARAVKITPGALYYYFPNKKELHESAVVYAYKDRAAPAVDMLAIQDIEPIEILEKFVLRLCERFYGDNDFRRLVQWTLLDIETDENIKQIIIKVVYETHFDILVKFLKKFAPDADAYRLTIFIFGLVMQNYFTLQIRRDHHGFNEKKEKPTAVTKEVMSLLNHGIFTKPR